MRQDYSACIQVPYGQIALGPGTGRAVPEPSGADCRRPLLDPKEHAAGSSGPHWVPQRRSMYSPAFTASQIRMTIAAVDKNVTRQKARPAPSLVMT